MADSRKKLETTLACPSNSKIRLKTLAVNHMLKPLEEYLKPRIFKQLTPASMRIILRGSTLTKLLAEEDDMNINIDDLISMAEMNPTAQVAQVEEIEDASGTSPISTKATGKTKSKTLSNS